jgi:hypothetical protein
MCFCTIFAVYSQRREKDTAKSKRQKQKLAEDLFLHLQISLFLVSPFLNIFLPLSLPLGQPAA